MVRSLAAMTGSDDDALQDGALFGRYTIVRRIGAGGMGSVYEATHNDLRKRVALKTLKPGLALRADMVERFVREGRAASRIRHPHIVDVSDVGMNEGVPFLVMEFLEGEDLASLLARERRLVVEKIAEIMLPVLSAVAAAHEEGVIHRDLKPENIFLARSKHGVVLPKVLDFGISKIEDGSGSLSLTNSSAILGTPYYMSPEQAASSARVDARSDQYSLGVILYECATGRLPFEGDTLFALMQAMALGDFPTPRSLVSEIPEAYERLVLRALAKSPDDRFASVHELGRALHELAGESSRRTWEPAFAEGPRKSNRPVGLAETIVATNERTADSVADRAETVTGADVAGRSTLAQSALEIEAKSPPRRGPVWIAAGIAALLTAVAGVVLSQRSTTAPRESRPAAVPSAVVAPVAPTVVPIAAGVAPPSPSAPAPADPVPSTALPAALVVEPTTHPEPIAHEPGPITAPTRARPRVGERGATATRRPAPSAPATPSAAATPAATAPPQPPAAATGTPPRGYVVE